MSQSPITEISQAEAQAQKQIEQAKLQAQKQIEQTNETGEQQYTAIESALSNEFQQIINKAKEKITQLKQQEEALQITQKKQLSSIDQKKIDQAVQHIISTIVGA